jgi:hypothetical protein
VDFRLESFPRIAAAEFDAMRAANEQYDARREELIKRQIDVVYL